MMKLFEKNVGTIDRSLRLGAGIGLIVGGVFSLTGLLSYVAVLVGFVMLVTGFLSTCALYSILGINTLGKKGGASLAPKPRKRK